LIESFFGGEGGHTRITIAACAVWGQIRMGPALSLSIWA